MIDSVVKNLDSMQTRQLESFGRRVIRFGANFAVCNGNGELVLLSEGGRFKSSFEQLIELSLSVLSQNEQPGYSNMISNTEGSGVHQFGGTNHVLAVSLKTGAESPGHTALIDMGNVNSSSIGFDDQTVLLFGDMLSLLAENFQVTAKTIEQMESIGIELSETYEELTLLHKLSMNMKVTESDSNFLQMACDSLTDLVDVEGIAILLEKDMDHEKHLTLAAGSGLLDIDDKMASILIGRLNEEINKGKDVLLDSDVDSHFRYQWSENIKNIIAVPLWGKERVHGKGSDKTIIENRIIGLMVAINRIDKPDFDSIDGKLFNSVANSCAVFVENGRLFRDIKELFVGSLRALTNSIDAKDQYTRGHSERVAYIAKWIAERYSRENPLKEEEIHKIYLAGLLHDIGKVGIDEAVLRKRGKLTEQELNKIKTHPTIGAGILSGIKQMKDIVPGVLYHHERIDGKGYPKGLTGDRIPLIGKIVGLADCFDAMSSERIYREAMSVEDTLAEIEKGLGTQFDEEIGKIFINSDIYYLWDIIQNGLNDLHKSSDLSEYGTLAVGTLIR